MFFYYFKIKKLKAEVEKNFLIRHDLKIFRFLSIQFLAMPFTLAISILQQIYLTILSIHVNSSSRS